MTGLEVVYKAVDDVNAQLTAEEQIIKAPDTSLLGEGSSIDSLQLVNLISAVELFVERDLGKSITLVDEAVFSAPERPLSSLASLGAYVDKLTA